MPPMLVMAFDALKRPPIVSCLAYTCLSEGQHPPASNTVTEAGKICILEGQRSSNLGNSLATLSGANLIKVMKIKFHCYRLKTDPIVHYMDEFHWRAGTDTGYCSTYFKHGRGYILQYTLYKSALKTSGAFAFLDAPTRLIPRATNMGGGASRQKPPRHVIIKKVPKLQNIFMGNFPRPGPTRG